MSSHITFDGNLAEDPAFCTSDAGVCYARLVVITNDRYRNRAGEWTTGPAVRHRVTAFHRLAENAANTFRKGDPVLWPAPRPSPTTPTATATPEPVGRSSPTTSACP